MATVRQGRADVADVCAFISELYGPSLHAKRIASLAGATLGVMRAASLAVAMIGHALAQARGLVTKHAVKQVDRLLSNDGVDVWDSFAHWVPHQVGERRDALVAMDWTDFDHDDQATLVLSLVTGHGRAAPLLWLSVWKGELAERRNDFEDACLCRLAELVPAGCRVTILADRGFGDQKLFAFLPTLGFGYVIRFRGNTRVTEHGVQITRRRCITFEDCRGPVVGAAYYWTPPAWHTVFHGCKPRESSGAGCTRSVVMANSAQKGGDPLVPAPGHLRAKVLRGGAYLVARQSLSLGFSLVSVFLITHLIGPAHYGVYVAANGIYMYLLNLAEAGVEVYLVRQAGQVTNHEYHVASTLLLAAGLLLVSLVQLGAGLLAEWVQVEGFERVMRVVILALPFQLLATAAITKLDRQLDYRRLAGIDLFGQACYYLLVLPMAVGGFGEWSLVAGWLVQQISACLVFHLSVGYLPRLRLDWTIASKICSYAFGFSLATWSWQLRTLVNPLIVGHLLGATAVGQIGMAIRIVEALTFVKNIAWRLSMATLSRIQHDTRKLQEAMTLGMQLQTLALAPVLLGFSWLGDLFLPHLLGARWTPVLDLFPFLAVSYLTNAQFNMHSSVLAVFRKNYENAAFCLVHFIMFSAGTAICVSLAGLIGYGWGEMLALPSYYLLYHQAIGIVGMISYRIAAVWWVGTVLGLFWHQLGVWAVAMPYIALGWPASIRQLRDLYHSVRPTAW